MKSAGQLGKTLVILAVATIVLSGCGPKDGGPPPITPTTPVKRDDTPPPPPAAPTISLSASPTRIERNKQVTLSWTTTGATSVVIDNGVGNVQENGSLVVTPRESITYTAVARNAGGEARSSTRVTVIAPSRSDSPLRNDQMEIEDLISGGQIKPVFFAYDKAELSAAARADLQNNARLLRQFPDSRIVIEGHCDDRGSEEYNLALGDRRAQAAYNFLIELGIPANRMRTISFGEERPFDTGTSEAAYAKNRRAHFRAAR